MPAALRQEIGIEVTDGSVVEPGQAAADLTWARDPFDRLISAHAIVASAPLVTAEETIREHLPVAVWDKDYPGGPEPVAALTASPT